ncbi:MAG: leucine-rich repeat domain-containing protein [Chitinispirillales bacterium]|nr:leucine-rich repeat domain-containing protein [Chitinispirillales bacterium]
MCHKLPPAPLLFTSVMLLVSFAFAATVAAQHDDRAVVRSILDKNGLKDMTVDNVAEFNRDGRVIVLNLNKRGIDGVGLTVFPAEIFRLTALKGLFFKGNALRELPQDIGVLSELVELNLADNIDLGAIPSGIGSLRNLKKLDIRYCGLTDLPPEVGNLKNLESLQMWGNGFIELPNCITELSSLKELYLKNNKLTKIPYDMIKMDNLKYVDVQLNYLCNLLPEVDAWMVSRDRRYKDHQYCDNVKR